MTDLLDPTRLDDNTPSNIAPGRGYARAVAFGTDPQYAYVFGGFGEVNDYSDEIWKYDFDADTWDKTGLTAMLDVAYFLYATSGSYGNKLVAAGLGTTSETKRVYFYDIDLNSWALLAFPVAGSWDWGWVGCAVGQYYYLIQGAANRRIFRVDIDDPGAGWTELTAPPGSMGITQHGFAIQDPTFTDRIVVFERDSGGVHYYSISGDSWTDLGNIYTPTSSPSIVFSVEGEGIYAGQVDSGVDIVLYRLDWTIPSFIEENTWVNANFDETRQSSASISPGGGLPTRIMFGAGYTSDATPAAGAEKWWGGYVAVTATPTLRGLFCRGDEIQVVFSIGNAYRSPDFGTTWYPISGMVVQDIRDVGFDHLNPQNSFFGGDGVIWVLDHVDSETYYFVAGLSINGLVTHIDCDLDSGVSVIGTNQSLYKTPDFGLSVYEWKALAVTDVGIGGSDTITTS